MVEWKGKKKAAIYIRRSKGESGDTKAQLERIKDPVSYTHLTLPTILLV